MAVVILATVVLNLDCVQQSQPVLEKVSKESLQILVMLLLCPYQNFSNCSL